MCERLERPVWPEMKDELKIKNLDRLLKALTGARKVRYESYPHGDGRIILEDVNVEDVKFVTTCGAKEYAGLVLEFEAEPRVADPPSNEFFPANYAVINAEIWFWEDPWATIDALKEQVHSLSEKANKEKT